MIWIAAVVAAICLPAELCGDEGPTTDGATADSSPVIPPASARLRVASVSFVPVKWDKAANAKTLEILIRKAAKQDAQLVVTPEGSLEGYVVNEVIRETDADRKAELSVRFRELGEPLDGPYVERFAALSRELHIHLVLGLLERDGDVLYNTALLLDPDGHVAGKYHKSHFAQGYDVNPPGYTPGHEYPVFDVGPAKLGMMICFDRQPPEPARSLALAGANVIVCPSYGGWGDWNTRLMQTRAYENQVYVVFSHPQHHFMTDPKGELLGEGSEGTVLVRDFDLSPPSRPRPSVTNRRPETYQPLADP